MPKLFTTQLRAIEKFAKSGIRHGPSPQMRNLLKKYGDWQIVQIRIARKPLSNIMQKIGNILTFGQLEEKTKELGYDNLYHLFMVITVQDQSHTKDLLYEKNQVVNLSESIPNTQDSMVIHVTNHLTLDQFIENGIKLQGQAYWTYDVRNNNCQKFILANLQGNGLLHNDIREFVDQNAADLIGPTLGSIANVVTSAASSFDTLQNGAGANPTAYVNNTAIKRKYIQV